MTLGADRRLRLARCGHVETIQVGRIRSLWSRGHISKGNMSASSQVAGLVE